MDQERRAELHTRLDELLDKRARLEALFLGETVEIASLENARDTFAACLSFAADVCGKALAWATARDFGPQFKGNAAVLLALRDRLALASGLLESAGGERVIIDGEGKHWTVEGFQLDIEFIRHELFVLANGDMSNLFAAQPRKPGQTSKRHQLANLKLRALEYDRLRKREGLGRDARQQEILSAFGVYDWERIRKWRGSCGKTLGREIVELRLTSASYGILEDGEDLSTEEAIQKDGALYQELAREPKLDN